jgi:CDP-6-deoxy-D-xylo-4-hexulose-3-dehydrase
MSTIEGGMISTNDENLYEMLRLFRSHGMVRESTSGDLKQTYKQEYPDLNPDFIFAYPAYNVRSTEINAVLGRSQLKRLDANNQRRTENLRLFFDRLDSKRYRTDFEIAGSCNYAFTLVLQQPDPDFAQKMMESLRQWGVEFRRGTAGGGNQLRQPYLRKRLGQDIWKSYPQVDHIHFYGVYIGNYPELDQEKIRQLCGRLNELSAKWV